MSSSVLDFIIVVRPYCSKTNKNIFLLSKYLKQNKWEKLKRYRNSRGFRLHEYT